MHIYVNVSSISLNVDDFPSSTKHDLAPHTPQEVHTTEYVKKNTRKNQCAFNMYLAQKTPWWSSIQFMKTNIPTPQSVDPQC